MYRQFSVTNAKGISFNMTREDAFFSDPKGLGTKAKNTYTALGCSYANTKESVAQKNPQGTMMFEGYEQYNEFMDVIKYRPLILKYTPFEGCDLYIECDAYEITKGEREKSGRLKCPIKFFATSTWYKEIVAYKNETTAVGKVYPYTYQYAYVENKVGTISFNNQSNIPAYVKLSFLGPAENPKWILTKNKEIVLEGKINISIPEGQRIIVNSDPLKMEIAIYDNYGKLVEDAYEKSDFSTERFIYLPIGESTLTCSHEGDQEIKVWAEVKENVE